jgi:site-specific recombinase XerD
VSELALRVRAESSSAPSRSGRWRSRRRPRRRIRRSYATAYRAFAGFLRARYGEASVDTFTLAAVAAWRDHLQARGLAPSSVAQRVSAVRRLAAAVGADPLVAQVRCTQVQHERPSSLSDLELCALLDVLPAGTGLSSGSST